MVWLVLIICVFIAIKLIVNLTNARCKSKVCLVGKTALITGGNSGIGLQLAKELASRGCKIIIADKIDASNTIKTIIDETQNSDISYRYVDFSSFKSIRSFAKNLKEDVVKLDILVNNVGISVFSLNMTDDGLQPMMQINYFSHFLLIHLLLDLLLNSSPSRIIFTSSIAAYNSLLSETNFKSSTYSYRNPLCLGPYSNAKLAGAIMSKILAKKLENSGVTSNVFHPGVVNTDIWKSSFENKSLMQFALWAWAIIFGKNIDEGVQTMLHLCCAKEVEKVSGKFFIDCKSVPQPKQVNDNDFCEAIWNLSEKYVKLEPEEKIEYILKNNKFKK